MFVQNFFNMIKVGQLAEMLLKIENQDMPVFLPMQPKQIAWGIVDGFELVKNSFDDLVCVLTESGKTRVIDNLRNGLPSTLDYLVDDIKAAVGIDGY